MKLSHLKQGHERWFIVMLEHDEEKEKEAQTQSDYDDWYADKDLYNSVTGLLEED